MKMDVEHRQYFNLTQPCRDAIDRYLTGLRPWSLSPTLADAFEAALFPGGKRLRSILALACGEVFGDRTDALLAVAASVELLHTASLILDDLPAMDNADARRNRPSLHRVYTPHLAILAAHGMVSQALHLPTQAEISDAACRRIVAELSRSIGPHGMAAGQADDLEGHDLTDNALKVAAWKTGYLFRSAAYCGAVAGGAPEKSAAKLAECGLHLGIAYQIADDLQDSTGEDDPERSVNAAALMGRENARNAFRDEIGKARTLAAKVTPNGMLQDFIEMMESHV